jgi:hypothetical protein
MPKPIRWLKEAAEIQRRAQASTYSHFSTGDIANLFGLMPRAASTLMEAMPRVRYGTSYIVPSEGLREFLDEAVRAPDVAELIRTRRAANLYVSRRKPRTVVLKEKLGNGLASLPECVTLTRGELRVKFSTALELGQALAILISNMEGDLEWYEFCRLYEPEQPALPSESAYEALRLGGDASYFVARGNAGKARDYARQAAHHAHWVQVERGTVTVEEYDREVEAASGVAGAMREIVAAMTAPDAPSTFSGLARRAST